MAYREVQESIIMENMHRDHGPSAFAYTPELAFGVCSPEIDYALDERQIAKLSARLAQIRIRDAKAANFRLQFLEERTATSR